MTHVEIHTLAARIAELSEDDEAEFQITLLALKSERARAEEERLARLRGLSDLAAVEEAVQAGDTRTALALLRDAGFVRRGVEDAQENIDG